MTTQIKYKGVYLEVHGKYEPHDPGDWDTPPSGGYFKIEKIMIEDTDVTNLLENDIEEIEVLLIKQIRGF